jgi:hypothetical protein
MPRTQSSDHAHWRGEAAFQAAARHNPVENLVRPAKLGMNWKFFGSLDAGVNNALLYTLMANFRSQGLDPEAYLTEVFRRLPHDATVEQAALLTPAAIAAEWCAKATDAEEVA